jgi:hypothetical protein
VKEIGADDMIEKMGITQLGLKSRLRRIIRNLDEAKIDELEIRFTEL